jgi:hypothetical protein
MPAKTCLSKLSDTSSRTFEAHADEKRSGESRKKAERNIMVAGQKLVAPSPRLPSSTCSCKGA